ncbi:MAG TPA: Ig-like domain-containing protein [Gemmatimonadaceae bacterium]|nr:Ig-like domain-containing protein [Gemmatimonadaceae bacterium]
MRPSDALTGLARLPRAAGPMLLLVAAACGDGALGGPGLDGGSVALRMQPRFDVQAGSPAFTVTHVRLSVTRLPDGAPVLDTLVAFDGPGGTALDLDVPMATPQDRFELRFAAADAGGDTIYRAVDTADVSRAGMTRPVDVLLRYAGRDTLFRRIDAGPRDTAVAAGTELPMWVVGFRDGSTRPEPLTHVTWSSSDAAVVRVSRTGGLATAIAVGGTAWIYASTPTGLVDSARVAVRAPLARLQLSAAADTILVGGTSALAATGRDVADAVVTGQPVSWSTAEPSVAVVSTQGVVTGVAPGTTTVTATSGALSDTATIVVRPAPVAAVGVTPDTMALTVGQRGVLSARATTAAGAVAATPAATWTTSDAAVATVSASGEVTARGIGTASIVGAVDGVSDTARVVVAAPPADAVVVSPAAVTIAHDGAQLLTASVTDSAGQPVPNAAITWSSSDPAVATVSAAGLVTARGTGAAIVAATSGGKEGSVVVTVLPPPVATVELTPSSATLVVGDRRQLAVTPRDAGGLALAGRRVQWSSSTPGVAVVSSNGLVTARGEGSATITASVEGRNGSTAITVRRVPVASVTLAPASATLPTGATQQLTATPRDLGGTVLTGRVVTWRSSDATVASVAADGLVTARSAGTATITATVDGMASAATIVVPTPELRTVRVTPASVTLHDGETVALAAQAYVGLTPVSGTFAWSSRGAGTATVSPGGILSGVDPGSTWIVATDQTGARDSVRVTVVTRRALAFDVSTATLGLGQRWGTGAGTRQICRDAADAGPLTVALASTDAARLRPQSSVTIEAGARCAPFDASAMGSAGSASILASSPTADGVEWTTDTLDVAVGQPRLRLTLPASLTTASNGVTATIEALDQAGVPRLVTEPIPLTLGSSDGGVAAWTDGAATIAEGAGATTATLNTSAVGSATLTATDARTGAAIYAPASATATVAFGPGTLEIVGWPADDQFIEDAEYRIRIYPANPDGTRRASFGRDVTFRFDQDGELRVYDDKYPTLLGIITLGSKGNRVSDDGTLTVSAGDAYLTIIVTIRDHDKSGDLTISETQAVYETVRLHGWVPKN